jgi:hypothetical protein
MKTVIWPRTDGDVILDLRERINNDGQLIPSLVVVDEQGKEKPFGCPLEFRDGGGLVQPYRNLIADDLGFVRANELMKVSPGEC